MIESREITLELLSDIGKALRNIVRDFLPGITYSVNIERDPVRLVLFIPVPGNDALHLTLQELAKSTKAFSDRFLPSLPLIYRVIGGTEASGIEIIPKPGSDPVYGHVHKAKLAWARVLPRKR